MLLEQAKKIVFEKRPAFGQIYTKYKDKKWVEYIKQNHIRNSQLKNEPEFRAIFNKIVSDLLGKDKADRAWNSLKKTGFASTADHHGLLCHPFFSNMAIARSSPLVSDKADFQITFSVGGVSPTNSSFPRSVFFHNKNLELEKIHLISLAHRQRPLYGIPAISKNDLVKIKDHIFLENISKSGKTRFINFIEKSLCDKNIWKQKRFCEQLTIINNIWWQEIFGQERGELLYLEAEEIIKSVLIEHISKKEILSEIFFDKERRDLYIQNFENISGAHNSNDKTGSVLFWLIDQKKNKRKVLFLNGELLETLDGEKIELSPEKILEGLENYSLMPSMALCYSILAFYYGITLGGGFSQIQYLAEMKKSWNKVFPEFQNNTENVRTDVFSGEVVIAGSFSNEESRPATLADFLVHTKNAEEANLLAEKALDKTTIGESIDAMMYELLEIISGEYVEIDNLPKAHKTLNVSQN